MKRTPEQALGFLEEQADLIDNYAYHSIARYVLRDERFHECFGGEQHHHVYGGGLLVHTAEVMDWVLAAMSGTPINLNADVLRTAVICHDYMKVRDYQWTQKEVETCCNGLPVFKTMMPTMESALYKKRIHHVQGSVIEFVHLYRSCDVDTTQADEDAVVHCLLSHHGRKEWGSQIEPLTPEANILHWADYMSMMFGEGR